MTHAPMAVALASLLALHAASNQDRRVKMSDGAQQYIAAFARGEDYQPPPAGVIVDGHPDHEAVRTLANALAAASPAAREQIVRLLSDMGRRTDPLTPAGADVLRDPDILAALAGPGLARPDVGRDAAMDALRKLATPRDLARFADAITKALEDAPSGEAFLLIAKAKPQNARDIVQRLAASPQWRDVQAAKIARAALGDMSIEDEFLAQATAAETAADGTALANALGTLGLIGTTRSLRAIGERLRTPLTIHIPGAFEKSVRLSALDALLYNFPDQPVLYPNNIITDDNYAAAEQFCSATLGVAYQGARPPFLTYRGYPIPVAR